MTLFTQDFLTNLGVSLSLEEQQALSDYTEEVLRERVIEEVIDSLEEGQAEQLSSLADDSLQEWLVLNVPELQSIVQDEVDILLGELAEQADQL
jgi:hypothetical protein